MNPASTSPSSPKLLTEIAGFDVAQAVERMLGQPWLWFEALQLFVQHFAHWEADWRAAQGDDSAERRCVHALRSGATNVGATRISAAAADLEDLLARRCVGLNETVPDTARNYLQDCFNEGWQAAAKVCQLFPQTESEKR